MKKLVAFCFILFCSSLHAQNLVPNGGFEELMDSSVTSEVILNKKARSHFYPSNQMKHWQNARGFFYLYYLLCDSGAPYRSYEGRVVCCLLVDNRSTHKGFLYNHTSKIYVPLTQPLDSGKLYDISLQVFVPRKERKAEKFVIGVDTLISYGLMHSFEIRCKKYQRNCWLPVHVEFMAKGGEKYLIIGRVSGQENYKVSRNKNRNRSTCVLIDEVALTEKQ